jgi:hypothetical protein
MNRQEWMDKRAKVEELLSILSGFQNGCGDGNCKIKKPTGIHTNGGCRCYRMISEYALELASVADEIKHIHGFSR